MSDQSEYSINLKKICAKDIMSEVVVTVNENALIRQAAHLMLRDRINGVPVVDDKKRVTGILTLTDLFKVVDKAAFENHNDFFQVLFYGKDFKVSEIMTRNVLSVLPSTTLDQIILMIEGMKIHTFPVIKNDKLLGIIGRHDILNAVFSFY